MFAEHLVKEDLLDIRAGIKAGRYVNEATVSQGIVQRLLAPNMSHEPRPEERER
jgi:hypothetical protein